jgi:hypothetical protein
VREYVIFVASLCLIAISPLGELLDAGRYVSYALNNAKKKKLYGLLVMINVSYVEETILPQHMVVYVRRAELL